MPSEFGEPWNVGAYAVTDKDNLTVVYIDDLVDEGMEEGRADRMVACVNFLRDVPTEILQSFPDGADTVALLACQEYVKRRKLNITGGQA